jgi:hypothetical protein
VSTVSIDKTVTISERTAESALLSLGRSFADALAQYNLKAYSRLGFHLSEIEEGTWPAIYAAQVKELWEAMGGPHVGNYVLAARVGDEDNHRRYRITGMGADHLVGIGAWSGADEPGGSYVLDPATAYFIV